VFAETDEVDVSASAKPDEVAAKLLAAMDRPLWFESSAIGSKAVVGTGEHGRVILWKRLRGRNSFQSSFYGAITAEDAGSRIHGRWRMPWITRAFDVVVLGGLGLLTRGRRRFHRIDRLGLTLPRAQVLRHSWYVEELGTK
jgi:hypothetical protein